MISVDTAISGFDASGPGVELAGAWASCMAEQGYDFPDQLTARQSYIGEPSVTEEELAVRAADLTCDRQTELTATRSTWERERFEAWAETSAANMTELETLFDEADRTLGALEAEPLAGG